MEKIIKSSIFKSEDFLKKIDYCLNLNVPVRLHKKMFLFFGDVN